MKKTLELKIKVEYDIEDIPGSTATEAVRALRRTLGYAATFLAGEGMLSGEVDGATVQEWDLTVHEQEASA